MKNKKERIELSYNPQITTDHDSGIIVANDVTQDCTDHHQLQPQVELTEEKGLDGYIPDSKQAGEMKGNKPRVITSDSYEGERRRVAAKMRSDTGKAEYNLVCSAHNLKLKVSLLIMDWWTASSIPEYFA